MPKMNAGRTSSSTEHSSSRKSLADWLSGPSTKVWGIFGLLIVVCAMTAIASDSFLGVANLESIVHRTALDGILSIGAAFVIITGGIDLSIGSVVCIVGVLLPYLLTEHSWPAVPAVVAVLLLAAGIGLFHGILITRLRIQPFVVTLCGLLLYRGIARGITEKTQGFGNGFDGLKSIVATRIPIFGGSEELFHLRSTALILIIIAIVAAVFLNKTIYGRYLLALGNNPEAARYSGINVNRLTVLAYVICSTLAGLGGMLYVLDVNAAQPSNFGNSYELYAIAAAVLGGCSLRGGEGSITGVVIGTAVIVVLRNTINLVFDNQNIEFAIIGGVILIGVIVDELARRWVSSRREAARHSG
jgi:ribose transport system permease protein